MLLVQLSSLVKFFTEESVQKYLGHFDVVSQSFN